MPFSAIAVANEFLKIAKKHDDSLSPMKLQKLVFYAHGWSLGLMGTPLISNQVEAWDWGPVIPELYHEFKRYGNGPITDCSRTFVLRDRKMVSVVPTLNEYPDSRERENAQRIIERIWSLYGSSSPAKLSNSTHAAGTPWAQVYEPGKRHIVIPDLMIKSYFEGLTDARQ